MTAIDALSWSLLHLLWEGAIIALLLGLVLSFTRSSRIRYGAACAALVLVLVGFAVTFAGLDGQKQGVGARPPALTTLSPPAISPPGTSPTPAPSGDAAVWLVALWMAGVLAFYLRAAGGWFSARRWRNTGVCAAGNLWQARLGELTRRLRVAGPVILLQSSLAEVPVVIGFLRPVILLPVGLIGGMSPQQIEYILLHELAHIRRHDYLVNLFQTLAEGLLFYHPAVWWISGVIRAERENCCDDVVAGCGDAREYAATLATLEEYRQAAQSPALAATGGNLMKRIRRLLIQPERPRAALTPILSALLVVISAGVSVAHQAKQQARNNAPAANPSAVAQVALPQPARAPVTVLAQARIPVKKEESAANPETPWHRWMIEDVAYIITDQERDAFRRLTSDEEREMFIRQFWQRRDPTPGTDTNEFKEEHYRRIAWTNQHLSVLSFPGWKTDRGRIYITYGPPDEIDSHPAGGRYTRPAVQGGGEVNVAPFEQWTYRHINGIGDNVLIEFIDLAADSTYRMTMDPHEKER